MRFDNFFRQAFDKANAPRFGPFNYQRRLASQNWPELLDIPTGMGKTAAVTLAWLWKRGWRDQRRAESTDPNTPRRLVWCLPMRVLVEQTADNVGDWLANLGIFGDGGEGKVSVHVLMGGADDLKSWAEYPEEDMVLIGTQDMLLSRALMRGYGMSRYQWPIHFSLLHNDCLWVFDEVQLMGAGLATSAQLEAFRRTFPLAKNSRTLWVSATLNRDWLATVDLRPYLPSLQRLTLSDADHEQAIDRLNARKSLAPAELSLTNSAGNKQGWNDYVQALCDQVLEAHEPDAQTLVIVNRVDRAQELFRRIRKRRENPADLLIHGRFRGTERARQTRQLHEGSGKDRIIIATQAIEAGVDISTKTLVTELAPWPSMMQRFGRCNRYGEHNNDGARILWVDIEDDADGAPYMATQLAGARRKLGTLASASPQDLPATDETRPLTAVLRRRDLLNLFNTDPDLSGFDVDVSDYIRDAGSPGVQAFWRDFADDPNTPKPQGRPARDELCPVSMRQIHAFHKRKDTTLWQWDALDGAWQRLTGKIRPGMTLLLNARDGGYDRDTGFDAAIKKAAVEMRAGANDRTEPAFGADPRSTQNKPVALPAHLGHVAAQADALCRAVGETERHTSVVRAGRWHDLGKVHPVFQRSMYRCHAGAPHEPLLAKSNCSGPMHHARPYFRHELASMLAWLEQHDGEPDANLIAYLILAHHGKVRTSLRAMPDEYDKYPQDAKPDGKRFARGVQDGDTLPALDFDGEHSQETTLKLALMEIGLGEQGASWSERVLHLLDQYGPFQLAWLESLVRLADWRASRNEQLAADPENPQNAIHGLENSHSGLAQAASRRAAAPAPCAPAAQSGPQHGLRGRAGEPGNAGSRTRAPLAATRYLDTALGVLSYAELAPHLARRVEALQDAINRGELDTGSPDENLFLELHHRICADLTPAFAGRWRKQDVVVGTHQPPRRHEVATQMRQYVEDLRARIASLSNLSTEPNERWLETLAFAEGRLLSIHPFTDFNGRVTRVFLDWLTRRLNLPDVDPTPNEGAATERYLIAVRAGDQMNWRPLMDIWRERLEQGDQA